MEKVIDTGRMLLRRFTADDVDAFFELCSRPEIIRYAQATPLASRAAALEFMHSAPFQDYATYGYGRFACVWKPTCRTSTSTCSAGTCDGSRGRRTPSCLGADFSCERPWAHAEV